MATAGMLSSRSSTFGSRVAGAPRRSSLATSSRRGAHGAVMMKEGIHPEFHEDAPVVCNGVEVMRVGGTKPQYNVDIYSGNHPFYLGNRSSMIVDEGQLNRFKKRFADLGDLGMVGAAASIPGKAEDPDAKLKEQKKAAAKKKK